MIGYCTIVLCCYLERLCFSFKVSLLRFPFLLWDVAYLSLKTSIELFYFPFLFSGYCRSAGPSVVRIVSGGSNQSSSTIVCSTLFVPQGTIYDLFARNQNLHLFLPLVFSTSQVGMLLVCSCLGRFLCLGPFGSIWSFLWLYIQIRVLLIDICTFWVLVSHEWGWNSWTGIHIFHHDPAFCNLIFF